MGSLVWHLLVAFKLQLKLILVIVGLPKWSTIQVPIGNGVAYSEQKHNN